MGPTYHPEKGTKKGPWTPAPSEEGAGGSGSYRVIRRQRSLKSVDSPLITQLR